MPDAATATVAPPRDATKEIGFGDAVREAIAEEMRRDPTVILMGEDVAEAGTTFKVLNRGDTSTPSASGLRFSSVFFLAFMMFGRVT